MIASAFTNELDERRRNALAGFLLGHVIPDKPFLATEVVDAERLYEYLLLDLNVSSKVITTRLLEAVGSVQLYIHRAIDGIEAVRFEDKRQLLAQWETDKEYRLWEANKRLGYYPSQYVDPTLLRDASPQYYTFIDALKQGKLGDKIVHRALAPYLADIASQGRSTIGGLCQVAVKGNDDVIDLYVTARMPGEGINWLLRKLRIARNGNVQAAPWEKITATLNKSKHSIPTPIYFEGAVHVVWLEESQEADTEGKKIFYISVKRSRRIAQEDWSEVEVIGVRLEYTDLNTARPYADRILIPAELTATPLLLSEQLDVDRWVLFSDLFSAESATTSKPYLFIWIDSNNAAAQYSKGASGRTGFRQKRLLEGGYQVVPHLMGKARYISVTTGVGKNLGFDAQLEFTRYQAGHSGPSPTDHDVSCISYAFRIKNNDKSVVFKEIQINQGKNQEQRPFSSTYPSDVYNGNFLYDTFFIARIVVQVNGIEEHFEVAIDCPWTENSSTSGMVCKSGNRSLLDNYYAVAIGSAPTAQNLAPRAGIDAQKTWHFLKGDGFLAEDGTSPFVVNHQNYSGPDIYQPGPSIEFPSGIHLPNGSNLTSTPTPVISNGNFALSFWIRHSDLKGRISGSFMSVSAIDDEGHLEFQFHQGIVAAKINVNDEEYTIASGDEIVFNDGKWHHIVHTFGPEGEQKLYTDGRLAAIDKCQKTNIPWSKLHIFSKTTNYEFQYFACDLAGLQLFDRVLTDFEVKKLYAPNWELIWNFLENYTASDGTSSFTGAQPSFIKSGPSSEIYGALHFEGPPTLMSAVPAYGIPITEYGLALWFRTSTTDASTLLIDVASLAGIADRQIFIGTDGRVRASLAGDLDSTSLESPLDRDYADGAWHHVVQTFGASIGGHRLYVDGALAGSNHATSSIGKTQVQLRFGAPYSPEMNCDIAGLKLFNHALSSEEVKALAQRSTSVAVRLYSETTAKLREHAQSEVLYDAPDYRALQSLPERESHDFVSAFATAFHPFDVNPAEVFAFDGYDGCYGWEVFFYMPWLVARKFMESGDFDNARRWLHYIFDPTIEKADPADCWICRPLREIAAPVAGDIADPDAIARSQPQHYQDAIIHQYFEILLAAGDTLYRNPTQETLRRAKMHYVSAKHLLGDKPMPLQVDDWRSPTLGEADDGDFKMPMNEEALGYWERVDQRLHNIRNNLTIDGKPLLLALLQPRLDPALLHQAASGGGISQLTLQHSGALLPHYRFTSVLETARSFVLTLISLGNSLQRTLEQQGADALTLLQQRHQTELINLTRSIQQEQVEMERHSLRGLQISRDAAKHRHQYFHRLYEAHISEAEQAVMENNTLAAALRAGSNVAFTIGASMDCIPSIFGVAAGGAQPGAVGRAIGHGLLVGADVLQLQSERLAMVEQYRRRQEEWQMQQEQAAFDNQNLEALIASAQRRIAQAEQSVKQQEVMREQAFAVQHFMQQRFDNQTLFHWMVGRLSTVYRQAYEATVGLCCQVEAACQYELGDFTLRFINESGAWNDRFRGLLAGDSLAVDLQRMELAHQQRNQRGHEITKTFSLKALGSEFIDELKANGKGQFSLTEALFDADYPKHYLRQIKGVSVTFPALLGPYQEVGAMLTQLSNTLYLTPEKNPDASMVNLRAYQQVALSQGLDDSGLFQFDFNDRRYLPFEGTGVHSTWELDFPGFANAPANPAQRLLSSLTDVIVQVRYTARG